MELNKSCQDHDHNKNDSQVQVDNVLTDDVHNDQQHCTGDEQKEEDIHTLLQEVPKFWVAGWRCQDVLPIMGQPLWLLPWRGQSFS